jgi:hypothetical protein
MTQKLGQEVGRLLSNLKVLFSDLVSFIRENSRPRVNTVFQCFHSNYRQPKCILLGAHFGVHLLVTFMIACYVIGYANVSNFIYRQHWGGRKFVC